MFSKVLIANRGTIASRLLRALEEMNIESVVVYSTADQPEIIKKSRVQASEQLAKKIKVLAK